MYPGKTVSARAFLQRLMHTMPLPSWREPEAPDAPADPFAWKPVPRKPPPTGRSGSVAVAEPDEE
jgi:hypothetical protein